MSLAGIWLALLRRRKAGGDAGHFVERSHVRVIPRYMEPGDWLEQAKIKLHHQDASRRPRG